MPPPLKLIARSLLVTVALAAAFVHPAPAAAATPCWKALLNDWYDGRIDKTYPVHCYNDALKHLPTDVQQYSSAHDDIQRALQGAIAKEKKSGHKVSPNSLVPPSNGGGPASGGGNGTTTGPTGPSPTTGGGRNSGKGLGHLANKLNPASASSLPIPLLVLGALAILLVAAGAVGVIAKQIQARKQAP